MKAAPFEYSRVSDVDEACAMLSADENARVIAGGQTLVPMMAMRLARPSHLIDINHIAALSYIRLEGDTVSIGATTRQCLIERDALVKNKLPLVARAISFVGHTATRARGTIGGSLANADPAAELSLVAITLDARLGYRVCSRDETVAAQFPVWTGKVGVGFHEVNARRSDFAFVSAAAQVEFSDDGTCKRIAIGVGAATDHPIRLESAERQLKATSLDGAKVKDAIGSALADIEPMADLHASADYRRRVAASLAARAVTDARDHALGKKAHAH